MGYVVLAAWLVQGAVGLSMLIGWLRRGRGRGGGTIAVHVVSSLLGLALWIVFLATGALLPAWLALLSITVGNVYGDRMLLGRARRIDPSAITVWQRYGVALSAIFRGKLPPRVAFHALFAGVVYFTCLGVCIGATVAAF